SARAARAAERSERGVRTRRASPAGARGGEPLADLAAATHPDPEAWPEGENPRGDRLPAVAVRPRRWQVVDGEPERREETREPHEIRDEHAGRHAVEPGRGRPAEVHRHVAALELLLEERQQHRDAPVDAAAPDGEAVVVRPDLRRDRVARREERDED